MKIFILEAKGEVLNVLTHAEDKTYMEFKQDCLAAGEEANNDYYTVKDNLINELGYELVDVIGGYEVNKRKGSF